MATMDMKKLVLVVVGFACAFAHAAYEISGTDSLAVGNLAGMDGYANRTVVIGTGAGAYMQGGDSNLFVGAAAGLRAVNVKSSVGMGHYAFRGTTNMTRCVGIGDLAFAGESGRTEATWINGHFFAQGGRFWIKPNRAMADDQAPIYYNAGNLYLNAGRIITQDGTTIGSGGSANGGGYDYYVSDSIGDDFNDGLTVGTAFKTLDKAFTVATNNQVVGVLAGSYAYPTNYNFAYNVGASHPVKFVGLSGADKTFIEKAKGGSNPGHITGSFSTWTAFEGFTFAGCRGRNASSNGAFMYTHFKNCVFQDMETTNHNYAAGWCVCVLEGCTIKRCTFYGTGGYGQSEGNLNPKVFDDCVVTDCVIDFDAPGNSNFGFSCGSHFENCFITGGNVSGLEMWQHTSGNFGTLAGAWNSTMYFDAVAHPNGEWNYQARTPMRMQSCLVGVDGLATNATWIIDTVVTNKATLALAIDTETLRPNDEYFDWYFYGYGSRIERLTKNAIVREVLRSLESSTAVVTNVQTSARLALARMAMSAPPAQTAPTVDYGTNGLTLLPPPGGNGN